jgi:hypothetical protein
MKMTLEPELAQEAKALVVLAFRNGPSEDMHAGSPCPQFLAHRAAEPKQHT